MTMVRERVIKCSTREATKGATLDTDVPLATKSGDRSNRKRIHKWTISTLNIHPLIAQRSRKSKSHDEHAPALSQSRAHVLCKDNMNSL